MSLLAAPKAVCFDIDGTLIDFQSMLTQALQAVADELHQRFGCLVSVTVLQNYRDRAMTRHAPTIAGMIAARQESFAQIIADYGGDPTLHSQELWEHFVSARTAHCQLFPEVLSTLAHLQNTGIRLLAASNGNTNLVPTGAALYFEHILYAEDLGVKKPDSAFFDAVCNHLSLKADAVWHVGDSHREDYQAAQAAGLTAVLVHRSEQALPEPTLAISNLRARPTLWGCTEVDYVS